MSQSFAYFLTLADAKLFAYLCPSQRQSPKDSGNPSAENSLLLSNITVSCSCQDNLSGPFFALEDFSLQSALKSGRTKVYYDANNQLALKAIDLWKQHRMLTNLQNEVQIYGLLADLQVKCIPKLVLHGYWEGGMYCLGLSLCGTVPKELSDSQKQSLLSTIDAIHDRGIIHNKVTANNILVDESGKVYLIDFGSSIESSCEDARQDERYRLVQRLERF